MIQAARDALPELPAERAERYQRDWVAAGGDRAAVRRPARARRLLRGGGHRGRDDAAVVATLGQGRAARAAARRVRSGGVERPAAGAGQARRARAGRRRDPRRRAPGARPDGRARRRPGRGRRAAEGLGAMGDDDELAAIVARVIEEHPDVAERVRGGNPKAIGALVGPVMKRDQGPRRRRRGQPPAARAARRLTRWSSPRSGSVAAIVDAQGRPTLDCGPAARRPRRRGGRCCTCRIRTAGSCTPTAPPASWSASRPRRSSAGCRRSSSTRRRSSAGPSRTARSSRPAADRRRGRLGRAHAPDPQDAGVRRRRASRSR